jgi:hypothetical protein
MSMQERISSKAPRELTSQEKLTARHLARDGASLRAIATLLNWEHTLHCLRTKLRALNIRPQTGRRRQPNSYR